MPATKTTASLSIVCLSDRHGRIDRDWLDAVRRQFPEARLLARSAVASEAGLGSIRPRDGSIRALFEALPEAAGQDGVLVLRSGLAMPPHAASRLASLALAAHAPPVTILPGNYDGRVNPLSGMAELPSADGIDSLVSAVADRAWSLLADAPRQALFIRADVEPGQLESDESFGLVDDWFVHDPEQPLNLAGSGRRDVEVSLGHVSARLADLIEAGIESLPYFGHDDRPVTLHISHAWGGGIARWIDELCRHDHAGHHLVLVAGAERDTRHYGQTLKLLASGTQGAELQSLELTPAIADTAAAHRQYRSLLDWLLGRYGVARVVVSSLIGHSLDCLRTGLPTLEVLHDFFPASPVLDIDPLRFVDPQGNFDLAGLLKAGRACLMFDQDSPAHWQTLRERWLAAVKENPVQLVAPTEHVAERWSALFPGQLEPIPVIPHGRADATVAIDPVQSRPMNDGRLRLVVVGRLSSGKGLGLLEAALDQLAPLAQIILVGAGRDAERLFGRAGVDVILNYRPEELNGLLQDIGPQAALFLSTVPETWNYVLSDLRALKVPVLATRLGAFAERIEDGRDGLLFEPTPEGLVAAVGQIAARPEMLAELVKQAPAEASMAEVIERYAALLPVQARGSRLLERADDARARAARILAGAAGRRAELAEARTTIKRQRADLARRTDWAKRQERLAAERTKWARSLDAENRSMQAQLVELHKQLSFYVAEVEGMRAREQAALNELDLIKGSLSWRLTRPLRLASRIAAALKAQRAWNPLTWPGLTLGMIRSLREHGLRGSLLALYPSVAEAGNGGGPAMLARDLSKQPVSFTRPDRPRVSIIIPVYNKVELTAACLHSLIAAPDQLDYEVIVVDDCSSDRTPKFLASCKGLVSARNRKNSGFIDTCNRGAELAKGEFLVFLNNDTTVTPGWLDALIEPFERDPDTGIVGARLVYPDGRLQEAGGIIFSDGSGWNYGREQSPDEPQYSFLSEADYVSGACLAIRAQDFNALGGFDTRYRPAYYEDTDLCFQVRAQGKKVIYQPASVVVHHEGATSGTDESSGTKRYQAINREKFRAKWAEMLAGHPDNAPDFERADPVRALRYRRKPKRVLVIDAATPQPDHDSGSVRMMAMLTLLSEMGYQVSFLPENLQFLPGYSPALQQAGIEVLSASNIVSIEAWLDEHGRDIDLVIGSRHYVLAPLLGLVRQYCQRALLVFDTVDLHFLREEREAEVAASVALQAKAAATRSQELGLIQAADITLVVSPVEQQLLAELMPGSDVRIVSNIHDVHGRGRGWDARAGLMFVGGFQHVPNVDAALWLVNEIFPLIRAEIPAIELHLIGSRMPPEVVSIDQPGVRVQGFVADLGPLLDGCRLSLAPLRYGAGVKGKVNQAMSHGLPVVATSCAAEGMFLKHGVDVLVADSAAGFAAEVIRAYRDPDLWQRLSEGGLANVAEHFSRAAAARALVTIDAEVVGRELGGR